MNFGIPKESPVYEKVPEPRVGLSPMGVKELLLISDSTVYVESNAGVGSGFSDNDYRKAGAKIVFSKEEAYKRADIILKVRRPQQEEFKYIKEGQTIMGFIHLVTAKKEFIQLVQDKKITLIGYEIIQNDDGRLPLVRPMSEIAGRLSVQIAGRKLESPKGGRGILLSSIPGIPAAEIVILGAGTLGSTAAKSFAGIGANVYVLDIKRDKLDDLVSHTSYLKITTMFATRHNIEKLVKFADVIICAVLVPGKRAPILITKNMVKNMKKGAVIIDFDVDQGGSVETAKISPSGKFIYSVDDVIHFCMPNATSLVARTATHAITSSIFPFLRNISEFGMEKALYRNLALNKGIYAEKGSIKKEFLS